MRRMSPAGLDLIKHFEGLHDGDRSTVALEPQLDCRGIPTLGWGAIYDGAGKRVTMQTPAISLDDADALLHRDTDIAAVAVGKLITVPIEDGQFDALVDFVYNLGSGRLLASTLRQVINRGEFDLAPDQLRKWVYGGGVRLRGLVLRREAECQLWEAS